MAATSYGLVLLCEPGVLLLAHATGTNHWDLPKGAAEPGESPRQAVEREVLEETGLCLAGVPLEDLGVQSYRADKQLHLFAARVPPGSLDAQACRCDSRFLHPKTGRMTPEVDRFAWTPFADIPAHCGKNLTRVLQALALPRLLPALSPVHLWLAPTEPAKVPAPE